MDSPLKLAKTGKNKKSGKRRKKMPSDSKDNQLDLYEYKQEKYDLENRLKRDKPPHYL